MQSLNEKNICTYGKTFISKLASFPSWLLISSPSHFFHGHTSKRLAYCRTTAVSFFFDIGFHGLIPLFEHSLSSRGAVPYPTTSLHPTVSVLILHPREIQLIIFMWSQTVRQRKPNDRNLSSYKASEMLAYRVRKHNKTGQTMKKK